MTTGGRTRRRPRLDRSRVLREGVRIADRHGLDGLSMRSLGRALGVEAMSLYNHVRDKDDLLDGMVDLVIAEIERPSPGDGWRSSLRRRAESARAAFARHPWAPRLIHTRSSSGPARLEAFEATLACLRAAGFPHRLTVHAISTLDAFVEGFGAQRLGIAATEPADDVALAREVAASLPVDRYPALGALIHEHVLVEGYDPESSFAFGLELVLDGLEARLEAALADGEP